MMFHPFTAAAKQVRFECHIHRLRQVPKVWSDTSSALALCQSEILLPLQEGGGREQHGGKCRGPDLLGCGVEASLHEDC